MFTLLKYIDAAEKEMNEYTEFDIKRDQFKERLEELNEKLTALDQPDLVAKLKEVNNY